ncbi:MAG: putative DEAD-box ATP-dependent RNA helicase 24 [Streblomastix strix]|uniref:RNA helicase n=1 Tax=Streblomastix strix TaxID=222440 RepID=A0A5J4W2G3_9EUKA|nr:MAG: putative DEAD-box ATP-dependent RNA helicase 24 [Streblomastix strix]
MYKSEIQKVVEAETYAQQKKIVEPCVLILVPTRELAKQIEDEVELVANAFPDSKTQTVSFPAPVSSIQIQDHDNKKGNDTEEIIYPTAGSELSLICGGASAGVGGGAIIQGLVAQALVGGEGKHRQGLTLRAHGCDILVGTPGRVMDMIRSKAVLLSSITMCILDEADRMLALGFLPQIEALLGRIRPDRQLLFFSATMPQHVEQLARRIFANQTEFNPLQKQGDKKQGPIRIAIGRTGAAAEGVKQHALCFKNEEAKLIWLVDHMDEFVSEKTESDTNDDNELDQFLAKNIQNEDQLHVPYIAAQQLLTSKAQSTSSTSVSLNHKSDNNVQTGGQLLIFCAERSGCDLLAYKLQRCGFIIGALHGERDQSERSKIVKRFRRGEIQALVATDVAARGMDIPSVRTVVSFDAPPHSDTLTHRVGRTGRMGGVQGEAFILFVNGGAKTGSGKLQKEAKGALELCRAWTREGRLIPEDVQKLAQMIGKGKIKGGKGQKGYNKKEGQNSSSTHGIGWNNNVNMEQGIDGQDNGFNQQPNKQGNSKQKNMFRDFVKGDQITDFTEINKQDQDNSNESEQIKQLIRPKMKPPKIDLPPAPPTKYTRNAGSNQHSQFSYQRNNQSTNRGHGWSNLLDDNTASTQIDAQPSFHAVPPPLIVVEADKRVSISNNPKPQTKKLSNQPVNIQSIEEKLTKENEKGSQWDI